MVDNTYSRGKIYMIESASAGLVYYGSTCNDLYKRMGKHRSDYKQFQTGKCRRFTSYSVLAHPDARIILVEAFPCSNKQELTAREAHYIRINNCVNKVIPDRTNAEYYQDNKESIDEKQKQPKHCQTCNCSVRYDKFSRHTKTKKHMANSAAPHDAPQSDASIVAGARQPYASDNQDEVNVDGIVLSQ